MGNMEYGTHNNIPCGQELLILPLNYYAVMIKSFSIIPTANIPTDVMYMDLG